MSSLQSGSQGTCVIGELTNYAAFASVAFSGGVWTKQYKNLKEAVEEIRRLGLIDRLFAVAAPQYIQQMKRHCLSPLAGKVEHKKLAAAGFRRAGTEAFAEGGKRQSLASLNTAFLL